MSSWAPRHLGTRSPMPCRSLRRTRPARSRPRMPPDPQMHELPLDLAKVDWSRQKEVVRVFYKEMWDHANVALVPQIFHPDFTFRGSLGPQLVGHEQFIGYVKFVTGALDRYTSDILALGEDGNQVFGKVRFHGYHRGELFEV